jgi:ABC-type amino acid transport substrate-binding protein
MDFFGLPHDLFQLYIPTTIISGKFDSMVTAMNLLVFALLGAAAMGGFLVLQRRRLLAAAAITVVATAVSVIAARLILDATIDTTYHKHQALRSMHAPREISSAIVHRERDDTGGGPATLAQIQQRGTLRIGYDPANLPLSFFNLDDELVGFDVELAGNLAASFGVRAEFVPIEWRQLPELLADGTIDVMPGTWYRPFWFPSLRLSAPYMTATMGLAVRDERRHEFNSVEVLHRSQGLKIGVPLDISQVKYSMARYFGDAEVEFVTLEFWQPFFEGKHPELDAFLVPAEHGAAWTLLHPAYTMVVPQPNPVKVPSAFGLALDAGELTDAVNEWVVFASNEGMIDRAYDYWILGKGAETRRPRWSIVRDVLGWVD